MNEVNDVVANETKADYKLTQEDAPKEKNDEVVKDDHGDSSAQDESIDNEEGLNEKAAESDEEEEGGGVDDTSNDAQEAKSPKTNVELASKHYSHFAKVDKRVHTEKPQSARRTSRFTSFLQGAVDQREEHSIKSKSLTLEDEAMVREKFEAFATKYGSSELTKKPFKELTKQLTKASGDKAPRDSDLDAAFDLADEDQGGTVDVEEFVHLYKAVLAGEVVGLSASSLSKTKKGRASLAQKQNTFRSNLNVKREEKASVHRQVLAAEEKKRERHMKDIDNTPEGEYSANMQKHGREMLGKELTDAKEQWEAREHTTVADDIGHLAAGTVASSHHHDKQDVDHTPGNEAIRNARKNARKEASTVLTNASDEYKKRQQAPAIKKFRAVDIDGSGSLDLQEVLAGAALLDLSEEQAQAWFEELDVDKSGDIDMDEFLAVYHERTATVTQDIGRLGKSTVASSSNRYDKADPAHMLDGEAMLYAKKNARKQASEELTKANDEFKKRQQAPAVKKFRSIDTDNSGSLDLQEVLAGASLLDLSEEQAQAWFEELDVDKSGDIDMEEFLAVYHERTATVAQDIGRLGKATAASSSKRYDKDDPDHTPDGEAMLYARKNARKQASKELTKASDEYKKRQQAPAVKKFRSIDTDNSGSLDLQEVLAGAALLDLSEEQAQAWFEELDVDKSGDIDMEEFLAVYHERTATVAEDIGRLAKATVASSNRRDKYDADFTPEAEYIQHMRVHGREIASQQLAAAKEQWEARKAAHRDREMKLFKKIDVDGSGELDLEEVQSACELLKLTKEQATMLFMDIDTDGGGTVDAEEFLAHYKGFTKTKAFAHAAMETESSLVAKQKGGGFKTKIEIDLKAAKEDRGAMSIELSDAKARWLKRQMKNKKSFTVAEDVGDLSKATESQAHHHDKSNSDNSSAKELDTYNMTHGRELASSTLSKARAMWERRQKSLGRGASGGKLVELDKTSTYLDNETTTKSVGSSRSRGKGEAVAAAATDLSTGREQSRSRGGEGLTAGLEAPNLTALEKWRKRQLEKQDMLGKQGQAEALLANMATATRTTAVVAGGGICDASPQLMTAPEKRWQVPAKLSTFWKRGAAATSERVAQAKALAKKSFPRQHGAVPESAPPDAYMSPRSAYLETKEEEEDGTVAFIDDKEEAEQEDAATSEKEVGGVFGEVEMGIGSNDRDSNALATTTLDPVQDSKLTPPLALLQPRSHPRKVSAAVEESRRRVAAIREARWKREAAGTIDPPRPKQWDNKGTAI